MLKSDEISKKMLNLFSLRAKICVPICIQNEILPRSEIMFPFNSYFFLFNMLKFVLYFLLRSVSLTSFFAFLQVKIIVLGYTAVV